MIRIWNKGETAESIRNSINTIIDDTDVNPSFSQIQDTFEQYSYDDVNLTAQQKSSLNSFFNSNGWTNIQ